eukprot:5360577-Alexandrium_andersonii.AAC.2
MKQLPPAFRALCGHLLLRKWSWPTTGDNSRPWRGPPKPLVKLRLQSRSAGHWPLTQCQPRGHPRPYMFQPMKARAAHSSTWNQQNAELKTSVKQRTCESTGSWTLGTAASGF